MIYCIPTDTCYGLACNLFDEVGYKDIYKIKNRSQDKPLAFVVPTLEAIFDYVDISEEQLLFLKQYEYPFTLLASPRKGVLPAFLDQKLYEYIAIRVGEFCIKTEVRKLLQFPLFLTSANQSNQKECHSYEECAHFLQSAKVPFKIMAGGVCSQKPSNIFSFLGDSVHIKYVRKNY